MSKKPRILIVIAFLLVAAIFLISSGSSGFFSNFTPNRLLSVSLPNDLSSEYAFTFTNDMKPEITQTADHLEIRFANTQSDIIIDENGCTLVQEGEDVVVRFLGSADYVTRFSAVTHTTYLRFLGTAKEYKPISLKDSFELVILGDGKPIIKDEQNDECYVLYLLGMQTEEYVKEFENDLISKVSAVNIDPVEYGFDSNENIVMIKFEKRVSAPPMEFSWEKSIDGIIAVFSKREKVEESKTRIMLDPGHGARFVGAVDPWNKTESGYEKNFNLELSKLVETKLSDLGYEILYTREDDKVLDESNFIKDNYARAYKANDANVDIYVSIHHNASESSFMKGFEIIYYPDGDESELLAMKLKSAMQSILGILPSKRIYAPEGINLLVDGLLRDKLDPTDSFTVTRETEMPSVIVEVGYMTNKIERDLLITDDYREKAAQAIAWGIHDFVLTAKGMNTEK